MTNFPAWSPPFPPPPPFTAKELSRNLSALLGSLLTYGIVYTQITSFWAHLGSCWAPANYSERDRLSSEAEEKIETIQRMIRGLLDFKSEK